MKKPRANSGTARKVELKKRLERYFLDTDEVDNANFKYAGYNSVSAQDVGSRILILLGVSIASYNFDESERVMDWLKTQKLWKNASENEKLFFRHASPSEELKQNLSWRFEAAYILAWAVQKVSQEPDPSKECSETLVAEFMSEVPSVGTSTENYFEQLQLRPASQIIDEALFYQTTTKYFKLIAEEKKENTSPLHSKACIQRDLALNWLLTGNNSAWDILEE